MTNMTFTRNSAGTFGGGIFADNVAILEDKSSNFEGNKAGQGGSAIYASSVASVDLEDSNILENSVESMDYGGAVMTNDADNVTMESVTMDHNSAGGSGAALWLTGAQILNLTSVNMRHNTADKNGGAIYASGISEKVSLVLLMTAPKKSSLNPHELQ